MGRRAERRPKRQCAGGGSRPAVGAPAESPVTEGTWPGNGWQPTKALDTACAHSGVCPRAPPWANTTVRHNVLCNGLAALANMCGIPAVTHDRPIGGGFGTRPADIFVPAGVGAPRPLALDVTVVTCSGTGGLNAAVLRKETKYSTALRHNPSLEFVVWGATESGWVSRGVDEVLKRWSRSLAARGDCLVGDPLSAVRAAAAACFAVAWMFQVAGWAPLDASGVRVPTRAAHRAVAAVRAVAPVQLARNDGAPQGARCDATASAPGFGASVGMSATSGVLVAGGLPQASAQRHVPGGSPPLRARPLVVASGPIGVSNVGGLSPLVTALRSMSSGSRFAPQAPSAIEHGGCHRSGSGPERGSPA